jgi:pimeloyl-ACP methyl ester carboxylesterase
MRILLAACLFLAACAHESPRPELRALPLPPGAFDAELSNYNYPREVKFFEFQGQGQLLRMAYELAEPAVPNGRTVLLFHGKNFSAFYWEPTIQALLEQGYRVIAPDQIGFGKSSKPAAYQFSFQALAQNTRALLERLKVEEVSVVGHSMGGMLAVRYALQYPAQVEKLVLVNPIGLEDWKRSVPYRSVEESYQAELKATPESILEYQRVSYFGGSWKREYAPLVEVLSGWTRHPDYPKVAWNSALTADMIFTQPVLYEFPLVKAPTLLIIGQRDRTAIGKAWARPEVAAKLGDYPKLGRAAARAIPKAKLVEIKGAGHVPQLEAFSAYRAALLQFLSAK